MDALRIQGGAPLTGEIKVSGSKKASLAIMAAEPSNLVFVLSDDFCYDFFGCAGHQVVRTPTLDRLSADGVRFRNAFLTTSICAASRATIFTGLTERSHGYTFGPALWAILELASMGNRTKRCSTGSKL